MFLPQAHAWSTRRVDCLARARQFGFPLLQKGIEQAHISALTFGRCFSSRFPACPGCRRPTVRTPSLPWMPKDREESWRPNNKASPKKSATFLFSGGSGKRDDTRNQNRAKDFISRPGLAAFWVGDHIAHSFAEERAPFLGRRPHVVPRICIPPWAGGT